MKRYFLATTMLAIGAAGVVWIAIREQAAAKGAKGAKGATTAIAEPTASAEAAPEIDAAVSASIDIGEAGQAADAGVDAATPDGGDGGDGGQIFPALTAYAAWSVVQWGMSAAEVDVALRQAGVSVLEATETKTEPKRLRAKSGPWDVTIDFGASRPSQIVVTGGNLSKDAALEAVAKIKERAPATKTIERSERHWKKEGGAAATLVTNGDGKTATLREEHVRERAPGGALGFAGLRWGMSTQEVVGMLTAAGYAAQAAKPAATAVPLPFNKGEVEGMASFNQFGLRQVEISGPAAVDGGAARAKELESSLGKPASVEVSTKTQHADHARMTAIDVEVTERHPGGGFTVVETYRPKN